MPPDETALKSRLINVIKERIRGFTDDCRTFLWVKLQHPDGPWCDAEGSKIGGGNLLMALGLFATLSYLSKIYVLLTDQACWTNPACGTPRVNETDAFQKLIKATPHKLHLEDLSEGELQNFWDQWRNKLAHLLAQNQGSAASIGIQGSRWAGRYADYLVYLRVNGEEKVFSRNTADDWWTCNVDKFVVEIEKITEWLSGTVEKSSRAGVNAALREIERK